MSHEQILNNDGHPEHTFFYQFKAQKDIGSSDLVLYFDLKWEDSQETCI